MVDFDSTSVDFKFTNECFDLTSVDLYLPSLVYKLNIWSASLVVWFKITNLINKFNSLDYNLSFLVKL